MKVRVLVRPGSPFSSGFIAGASAVLLLLVLVCGLSALARQKPDVDVVTPQIDTVASDDGPLAGGRVISYYGTLSKEGNSLLVQRLEHTPKDRPLWVSINSGGGDLYSAVDLAEYVNKNDIGIAVTKEIQCSSACVTLFSRALRRFASNHSYFGFHFKVATTIVFDFGSLVGAYQHVYPMTDEMDRLSQDISGHPEALAAFFRSCTHGNPAYSYKLLYLSWQQILDIVNGDSDPKCDEIAGQNLTWLINHPRPGHPSDLKKFFGWVGMKSTIK